jgi:predicted alpha/beta hydrolase family esterase
MTVLILHGIGGSAGVHWQQWLHDRLVQMGHTVMMPSLPHPQHPNRSEWLANLQIMMQNVDLTNTIIVGHSLGVATALDYIETIMTPVKGLFSVSGFGDDYGAELNSYFMREKAIDYAAIKRNASKFFVFYGDNDPYVPQLSLKLLADNLGVEPHIVHNGGHINSDAGFTEFPLLLNVLTTTL